MRIALVADWLPTYAGAEHVIAAFRTLWPDAPIHTTLARFGHIGPLDGATVRVSRLQGLYRLLHRHQVLLPFMPQAMESMDLRGYDVVLSSSHAVGKGIIPPSDAVHVCYCHTPMRYAWEMEREYIRDFRLSGIAARAARSQLKRLRRWDLSTAKRTDVFIANSRETQRRIAEIYGRDSIVVPPPVEERFFEGDVGRETRDCAYFLAIGRFVPYKRFDLLIETANALGIPLHIVGRGQDEARLRALAGPTVRFLGFVPDADLPGLYAHAKALLFPQLEDAGVVPLEAQASGTPVIAFGKGGAVDTVVPGKTGVLFPSQTQESLAEAIREWEHISWDRELIREHARQFRVEEFTRSIEKIVRDAHLGRLKRA